MKMTDEERYRDLWDKYYRLSLRDCRILDEEIEAIDEQIRRLQIRRKKLMSQKHQENKERIEQEKKRQNSYPILYRPFKKNRG